MTNNTTITKDMANKKLHVTRNFAASVDKVWKAWTDSTILDKWWAPKPWRTETKKMNFTEGGQWLYAMAGPNGEKHWSKVEFETITPETGFSYTCTFCDEGGNTTDEALAMHWTIAFYPAGTGSKVEVELRFDNEANIQKIVEMGFEGGFTMALGNLDELLAAQ